MTVTDRTVNATPRRLFGVIPAAGFSRRMGQPKLLMKISQQTVIKRLITNLEHPHVSSIAVLVRSNDSSLIAELDRLDVSVIIAGEPTFDMKESVRLVLEHLARSASPSGNDGWMLIPADHPIVMPTVVEKLINAWLAQPDQVIVPTFGNRSGHPVIFPWRLTKELHRIPEDQGLNWLVKQPEVGVKKIEIDEPSVLWDLDTPEDFERIRKILED